MTLFDGHKTHCFGYLYPNNYYFVLLQPNVTEQMKQICNICYNVAHQHNLTLHLVQLRVSVWPSRSPQPLATHLDVRRH